MTKKYVINMHEQKVTKQSELLEMFLNEKDV